jgi:hypothetical protein
MKWMEIIGRGAVVCAAEAGARRAFVLLFLTRKHNKDCLVPLLFEGGRSNSSKNKL